MNRDIKGYVLSVDPASNSCGVSLWKDGTLIAGTVLKSSSSKITYSRRIQELVPQLKSFLTSQIGQSTVHTVVCEGVRARIVQVALGALLVCEHIDAKLITAGPANSFVESMSWKSWAQRRGATGPLKDIKGVKALRDIGFPVDDYKIVSDDVADSILVYQCWRTR